MLTTQNDNKLLINEYKRFIKMYDMNIDMYLPSNNTQH